MEPPPMEFGRPLSVAEDEGGAYMELAPDTHELSNDELDRLIGELVEREATISYERSVIQARLDLLLDEREERKRGGSLLPVQPDRLGRSLRRRPSRIWGIGPAGQPWPRST
jgi:hypothetical protein